MNRFIGAIYRRVRMMLRISLKARGKQRPKVCCYGFKNFNKQKTFESEKAEKTEEN